MKPSSWRAWTTDQPPPLHPCCGANHEARQIVFVGNLENPRELTPHFLRTCKRCRSGTCRALSVGRGWAWRLRLRTWLRTEGLLKQARGAPSWGFTWWRIWYDRVLGEVRGMSRSRRLTRWHQPSSAHERAAGEYVWAAQLLHAKVWCHKLGRERSGKVVHALVYGFQWFQCDRITPYLS